MADQQSLGIDHGGPNPDYLADKDTGLTPTPVVRQGLEWLRDELGVKPKRILDPSAGHGVFGMMAREVWPDAENWGVELHGDCLPDLARNYTHGLSMPLESLGLGAFDLIATNPPFSRTLEWVPLLRELLTPNGRLVFLAPNGLGQRGEDSEKAFLADTPLRQARIAGPIEFKGPGTNPKTGKPWGADVRDYSWWVWSGPGIIDGVFGRGVWKTTQLPRLPSTARQWKIAPGTEPTV